MDAPRQPRLRLRLRPQHLLALLLLPGLGAGREVSVPPGPLHRVEGTAVAIPCSVAEYEGPTLQHFEWFVYRPAAPDIAIGAVSTRDPKFPYAVFAARVEAGNVSVHRVRGDAVELRIRPLRAEDGGVYECYTPTTDSKYHGSYSGKVELRVIPDTLSVSPAPPLLTKPPLRGRGAGPAALPPPPVALVESQELRLGCLVASGTRQHTHLSVSFGLASSEDRREPPLPLREVIAARRDFAVEAGRHFAGRFGAQELSLAKLGDQQFQMALGGLRPEDGGTYSCTAGEWIQDPDGSWQQISERQLPLARVSVRSIASQLSVSASPARVSVASGEALELLCNVSGLWDPPLPLAALSVAWEVSRGAAEEGRLVAQLGVDGALLPGEGYASRGVGNRHLSLQKLAAPPGLYRLRLEAAQPGDAGSYRCVARAFVRSPGSEWRPVADGRSEPLAVDMKSDAVVLEASAWLPFPTLYRGETAEVVCNVSVESAQPVQVALSWWAEMPPQEAERRGALVAAVSREGVADLGSRPSGGAVSVDKVGPHSHRLRLHAAQPSDEGQYHCAATAWVRYPDGSWYKAGSAKSNVVNVYPYALPMDTLLLPLVAGASSALLVGISILVSVTCCFMRRLRKR